MKFTRLGIWASFSEFKLATLKQHLGENGNMSKSQVIRVRHPRSEPQGRLLKLRNAPEGEQGSPEAPLAKDPPLPGPLLLFLPLPTLEGVWTLKLVTGKRTFAKKAANEFRLHSSQNLMFCNDDISVAAEGPSPESLRSCSAL